MAQENELKLCQTYEEWEAYQRQLDKQKIPGNQVHITTISKTSYNVKDSKPNGEVNI